MELYFAVSGSGSPFDFGISILVWPSQIGSSDDFVLSIAEPLKLERRKGPDATGTTASTASAVAERQAIAGGADRRPSR